MANLYLYYYEAKFIARTLRQARIPPTPACPLKGKQWTAGGGVISCFPPEAG